MFAAAWRWVVDYMRKVWNEHWDDLDKWCKEDPQAYEAFIMEHWK